jgi:hypothetical protein
MEMRSALAVLICVLTSAALAQNICPATQRSNKLICLIPQIYGADGLTLPNPFHSAHFDSDFESSFTPLNAAIGTQLTALPIASPASGFTFSFDRSLGVFTRSTESYGPVLTERAETIGRHKLFIAFTINISGSAIWTASTCTMSRPRTPTLIAAIRMVPLACRALHLLPAHLRSSRSSSPPTTGST